MSGAPALNGGSAPSCSSQPLLDFFVDGWFIKGWQCTMAGGDSGLMLVLGLIIYAAISLALFISTGSLAIPSVLGIIFAGIIFISLPATAVNLALITLVLAISVGGLLVTLRLGG
jgi:hypothetical protein